MAIREGRWDCPSCGAVGQLGRDTRCSQCGDRRPEGIRFYLPADEAVVQDATRVAQARAGADWICEHCGGSARAADTACPGCGAPRGSSPTQRTHEYTNDQIPRSGDDAPPQLQPLAGGGGGQPKGKKKGGCGGCLLLILGLIGGVMWLGRPRDVESVVESRQWLRSVQVEENRLVTESDWTLPAEGELIRQFRDVRDHRQVLDHYETRTRQVSERVQTGTRTYTCGQRDMGNGYFEDVTCTEPEYDTRYHTESYQEPVYRSEPIYDTKYEYRIWRWVPANVVEVQDTGEAMRWPVVTLRERQREGPRKAVYQVTLRDAKKDKAYAIDVDSAQFTRLRRGQSAMLRVKGDTATLLERTAEAEDPASK